MQTFVEVENRRSEDAGVLVSTLVNCLEVVEMVRANRVRGASEMQRHRSER